MNHALFDCFPDGQMVLGGAPFNVAWNLQALGLAPHLVSRVGTDSRGDRILQAMEAWGMDLAGIQKDDVHPTGEVRVTIQDGEPRYEIITDRAYDFVSTTEWALPRQVGLLYHGSLALRSSATAATFDHLRSRISAPILMDVNLRNPWWNTTQVGELMGAADWVKLNEDELRDLVPAASDTKRAAARLLEDCDLEAVVITRGAAGAWARGRDGWLHEPEPVTAAEVVDTVGAGDAFSSVVICGLMRGWPWPLILDRAQVFAAAVVGIQGATTRDRSFYASILENWEL
jgi:fructokinase